MKQTAMQIIILLCFALQLSACKSKPVAPSPESMPSHEGHVMEPEKKHERKILYYVDSMHPWYKSDKPGIAPDCGMPLTPVYEDEIGGPESAPSVDLGRTTVQIAEAKQQLIGVKTETMTRQALVREIDAAGRVAFDPDLYIAQSEYLIARRTGGGDLEGLQGQLAQAARSRLQLLGMSEGQIRDLERQGRAQGTLVVAKKGEAVWIYGSIFESELPWVKVGDPVEVQIPNTEESYHSSISSIDPIVNSSTRSAQIRVRVSNANGTLRPDMYVKLKIQAGGGEVLAVPDNAIIETGKRKIAFVEVAPGRFEPRQLKLGRRGTGYAEVLSGLSEGDKVVINGNFLLDSESSLKASISGGHEH
jgi:membrane fusion protein, copper/silver efflux system